MSTPQENSNKLSTHAYLINLLSVRFAKPILILLLTIIVLLILTAPRVAAYWYFYQASQLMDRAWPNAYSIPCSEIKPDLPFDPTQIEKISNYASKAADLAPSSKNILRLQARLSCFFGNFPEAIDTYNILIKSNRANFMDRIEVGFAYISLMSKGEIARDEACQFAVDHFYSAKLTTDNFLDVGKRLFKSGNIENSKTFIDAGECFDPKLTSHNIPLHLIYWIVGLEESYNEKVSPDFKPITIMSGEVTVEAENLLMFSDVDMIGEPIEIRQKDDVKAGVLFSNYAVGFFTEVEVGGDYQIHIKALRAPPAPIEFQLEHNFQIVERFKMSEEDESWAVHSVPIYLDQGWHVLGVRFLNDAKINGIDRNLFIDWIKIDKE